MLDSTDGPNRAIPVPIVRARWNYGRDLGPTARCAAIDTFRRAFGFFYNSVSGIPPNRRNHGSSARNSRHQAADRRPGCDPPHSPRFFAVGLLYTSRHSSPEAPKLARDPPHGMPLAKMWACESQNLCFYHSASYCRSSRHLLLGLARPALF